MNKDRINKFPDFEEFQIKYYKKHPEEIKSLVEAVIEDYNEDKTFDPKTLMMVLAKIAKLKGMADTAKRAKITREGLYRALSAKGNPSFVTFNNIANTLGYKVSLIPK